MPVHRAASHSRRIGDIRQGGVGYSAQGELLDCGLNQELPRALRLFFCFSCHTRPHFPISR
ncbi:Uncharacterised protein [Klebsiella pneumoniae]|uniref:Uncharacterized protein n=1 Tax=Klebsiella pneumoniae TaxID=573 RepID=A0A2X3DBF7_KLEPN|nr:Uncharacterised protein [Klebsiella pneumoniae]